MSISDHIARRVGIHHAIVADIPTADRLIRQAAPPSTRDAQWRTVFGEALGDLDAADTRGQGTDDELRLLGALIQWRLERRAADDACRPLGDVA